jgi:large subunit ribosomal protein L9
MLERDKAKFELQIAKEKEFAQEMANRLEGVKCEITAKAGEENKLYGSVSVNDIIESLASQKIEVEKRMVLLANPIKETGTYQVPIRIYSGVKTEITVEVTSE